MNTSIANFCGPVQICFNKKEQKMFWIRDTNKYYNNNNNDNLLNKTLNSNDKTTSILYFLDIHVWLGCTQYTRNFKIFLLFLFEFPFSFFLNSKCPLFTLIIKTLFIFSLNFSLKFST